MSINKVVYGNATLIDLTWDTVTPQTLASGKTAHDRSGAMIMGTAQVFNEDTLSTIFNAIYPVGSIYMSMTDVSPSTLFGGTWVRIGVGRTLVSAGGGTNPVSDSNTITSRGSYTGNTSWFAVGQRGGETNHTLSVSEMPSHTHKLEDNVLTYVGGALWGAKGTNYGYQASKPNTDSKGGGSSHNNVQPYLAVYMWQRTA